MGRSGSGQFRSRCTSLIMSPPGPIRNVPYTATSRGGPVEEDSDEYEGTSTSRGFGASEEADAEAGRRSEDVGVELSAGEETVATISERRSPRTPTPQCGKKFEPSEAREIPAESATADPREVFRRRTGEVRTEAGSRTFGGGGWVGSGPGDAAMLDVSGRIVEPQAQTESAPEAPGTAGTLWRLGAGGWEGFFR